MAGSGVSRMKKILPVVAPPLKGFVPRAFTLAITHADPDTHDWFYTNFVLLSCTTDYAETGFSMDLDFWRGAYDALLESNPFLIYRMVGYDSFLPALGRNTLLSTLTEAIDQNYYPMVFVDESRLAYCTEFGTEVFYPHHTLLYGYDSGSKSFNALGFGRGENGSYFGRFGPQIVSFAEIVAATDSMRLVLEAGRFYDQMTFFLKLRKMTRYQQTKDFHFDGEVFRTSVVNYLEGRTLNGSHDYNPRNLRFGINVYDELERYYDLIAKQELVPRNDVRHIHILQEHKKLMLDRLCYMRAKGIVSPQPALDALMQTCRKQADRLAIAKLLALKNHDSTDPGYCGTMRSFLGEQRSSDEALMSGLLGLVQ